jgi:D-3-phosphoglycerate dehydrogenase
MDIVEAKAAAEAGIAVGNVNAGTDEVADHAMALLLTAGRMVLPLATATAHHNWDLRDFPDVWTIRRMRGQTLGVVGAGRIGRAVAQRARAFGMNTVATYHQPPNPADPDLPHVVLEDLFERSDAIVVCAALNDETRGLIDSSVLARTKPGAILVNVSRGGLINEDALVDALETGRVRMAALDVRESEPPVPEQDRLTGRSDVIQTPHIGGVSREAAFDLHRLAAETCLRILSESRRL